MLREMGNARSHVWLVLGTLMVLAAPLGCQRAPNPRRSQPATVSQTLGDVRLTLAYNRPVARGRILFGGIVPWGEVWCPCADEATSLETSADIMLGGQRLPEGKYTIWAIPGETEWTLILSNAVNVWHIPYPGVAMDRLRLTLAPQTGTQHGVAGVLFPDV